MVSRGTKSPGSVFVAMHDSDSVLAATIREVGGNGEWLWLYHSPLYICNRSLCLHQLQWPVLLRQTRSLCSPHSHYSRSRYSPCYIILTVHILYSVATRFEIQWVFVRTRLQNDSMCIRILVYIAWQHECNREKGKGSVQSVQSQVFNLLPSSIN